MIDRASRSVIASAALACLLVAAGCVGGLPGGDSPSAADTTGDATTDAPRSSAPTSDTTAGDGTTSTDGPASGDLSAQEVLDRVAERQRSVEGYSANVSYGTTITLTNDTAISRNRSEAVAVRYGNDTAPSRSRTVSFYEGERRRVEVATAENYVTYNVTGERYRYTERGGEDHFGQHYSLDELRWATDPQVLLRENDATYEGTETVNGREAYVVSFDAKDHPNGPGSTATAYFARQTYWFDTETGILLKHVAHKPVRRFDTAYSEYSDPRNDTGGIRDDNGDDAVYLEHKVRTTTVTNLTVNPEFAPGTFAFDPPADAQPVGAPDDEEPEDD